MGHYWRELVADGLVPEAEHMERPLACKRGHELTEKNLRLTKAGGRVCKTCERIRQRAVRKGRP